MHVTTRAGVALATLLSLSLAGVSGCGGNGNAKQGGTPTAAPRAAAPRTSNYTTVSGNNQPLSPDLPIALEPRSVDFGVVDPESAHVQMFTVSNLGTSAITLVATKPSCKCTTLDDLEGRVIAPGATLEMPTELRLTSRPGEKTSYVQLVFETGGRQRAAKVNLRAVVELPVRATPPYVDALKGVSTGTLTIDSGDGRPFRILSSNGETPDLVGFDPATDEPRSQYVLRWTVAGWPCDGMRKWLIVETDRADCPILPCRIRHDCTGSRDDPPERRRSRGWYFGEQIVNAGLLPAGKPATLTIDLVNTEQKPVSGVMSLSPLATAKMLSADTKGDATSVTFEFTPAAGYEGMLYALVNVLSPSGNKDVAVVAKVAP